VAHEVSCPFFTVDADVVVPTAVIGREHWAARTIRPRLHEHLAQFLVRDPAVRARVPWGRKQVPRSLDPRGSLPGRIAADRRVEPVASLRGGPAQAKARLRHFLREQLDGYARRRNRPDLDGTSQLSPYLHFGHIGPREVALAVRDAEAPAVDKAAFLEQLIVRRELAVSFVRFNSAYDRLEGCERWGQHTLRRHAGDERRRVSARRLEDAESPDPLWNAAQAQMLQLGWMHGYLRMYWAKRLLEWTRSPEEAFDLAIRLNDRYELDGTDPNGYAGIAWAIGGKHDQAFAERPIYGKVRYMSPAGMARKLHATALIGSHRPSEGTPTPQQV
jgi:deoxyribodipyrimidine photo-lyase